MSNGSATAWSYLRADLSRCLADRADSREVVELSSLGMTVLLSAIMEAYFKTF